MISFEEVFPIGQIQKTHGVAGEMACSFSSEIFSEENIDFVVLDIEGILVPFYISSFRPKGQKSGLLMLEGINSETEARQLSGKKLYIPKYHLDKVDSQEIDLSYFIGFEVQDGQAGRVGRINDVDETTPNSLFVVSCGKEELLIPAGADYIRSVDHEQGILYVDLPEGLIDLA